MTAAPDLLVGLRNGRWLDEQTFLPLRYSVPELVAEGLTLLVGPPKIGKSWLVLDFALAKAGGRATLGSVPVQPGPVLYLALEDGDRRMQDRCRRLLDGAPIPETPEYLTRVEPERVIQTISAWMKRHTGAAPLIVMDTLGKVMPPMSSGESVYQRDYRIASELKGLADSEPGCALLTSHHDRKATSDDFIDSVSGTHGLAGAADTTLVLVRSRNRSEGLIKVTGRDILEGEYAVTFDNGAWRLTGADLAAAAQAAQTQHAKAGISDRSDQIIAYVDKQSGPVTPADVAAILDLDNDTAGKYLRRLAASGHISRESRGTYIGVRSVRTSETAEPPAFGIGHSDASDTQTDGLHLTVVGSTRPGIRCGW